MAITTSPTCPRWSRDTADAGRFKLNRERKCGVSAKEMLQKTGALKKKAAGAARWTQAPTALKAKTPPPGSPRQHQEEMAILHKCPESGEERTLNCRGQHHTDTKTGQRYKKTTHQSPCNTDTKLTKYSKANPIAC